MMTAKDVQTMMKNHGAFMHETTPMCAIYSDSKKVKWTMTSYMSKIAKGIIDPLCDYSTGRSYYNSLEYVLQNRFDPVMQSTTTSNLWRAPYAAEIRALSFYDVCVFFRSGGKFILESSKSGHRICLPALKSYSSNSARGTNTDGTGKTSVYTWVYASSSDDHLIAGRSVRSFGSNNPAYMQALDLSFGSSILDGRVYGFAISTKFNMAYPVLPIFRWKQPDDSTLRVIEW